MSVKFTQSCPTCGRRIQIRASLLGSTVACQHCRAEFVARAGGEELLAVSEDSDILEATDPLMARVQEALERVDRVRQQATVS